MQTAAPTWSLWLRILGWAETESLTEALRRRLRARPLELRRFPGAAI